VRWFSLLLASFAALTLGSYVGMSAMADPYRWCAEYGSGIFGGGHTSCYFNTFAQCQASVSGVGGYCRANPFYDGRAVTTPEDGPPRRKRQR
jgi:hypothetical protein